MHNPAVLDLLPAAVWQRFAELSKFPRPSKQEQQVVLWLKNIALEQGMFFEQDEVGNVLIRKPATAGCEQSPAIILQSHLDMVGQKRPDIVHDFSIDPITLIVEGDWLRASGTTLGADNGIGVAAMVAVLCATDIAHGALECLFTVDEEAGLHGAAGLRKNWLKGEILLNLDSEDEGELYIGCAGGQDIDAQLSITRKPIENNIHFYQLSIGGLLGGHSGVDIHRGRGNAIQLLARVLTDLRQEFSIAIASMDGGSVRNAIPREANAIIGIHFDKQAEFLSRLEKIKLHMERDWYGVEPAMQLLWLLHNELIATVFTAEPIDALLMALHDCPHGVIAMCADMPLVVETSCNIGALKTEANSIRVQALARSSLDAEKQRVAAEAQRCFEVAGCHVKSIGGYPGWMPDVNSLLLKKLSAIYQHRFGEIPEVKVIHAGLECGLLGAKYPQWQMISFGPTIRFPHSPDEKVHIPSVDRFWILLKESLRMFSEG
jgi:dipeptidase D